MSKNRRSFLQASMASVASGTLVMRAWGKTAPSDRVHHAVIGTGGQGSHHVRAFSNLPNADVVAIADVDPQRRARAVEELPNRDHVRQYADFRDLLDDKSIDTVSIATPDHWHTPVALAALMAGKHVYVEKPCSHTLEESYLLAKAATETKLCVQHGTQRRGNSAVMDAIQFLRDGGIGKVLFAKAINHQRRGPIGRASITDPPPGVNYDLWLGPAPKHAFTENRWHYQWHWFWDYGTGDFGNDGVHQVDVARWGLGVDYPKRFTCSGGQLWYDDDHETPDTINCTFEYDDAYLMFEQRLWTPYKLEGHDNGNVFYGTDGKLVIGRSKPYYEIDGTRHEIPPSVQGENTKQNFVRCAMANDPSQLLNEINDGSISADLCHLGNIAIRTGRGQLAYDPQRREFPGAPEATRLVAKPYRAGYELAYHG